LGLNPVLDTGGDAFYFQLARQSEIRCHLKGSRRC
jgi:hypothetical protein